MPDDELVLAIFLGIVFSTIVVLVVTRVLGTLAGRSARSPFLALSSFDVDTEQGRVTIEGRQSGLRSWVSTRLRVGSGTALRVSQGLITFETNGLFSFQEIRVPVRSLASVSVGFMRPVGVLIVATGLGLAAIALTGMALINDDRPDRTILTSAAVIAWIFAILGVVRYSLGKQFRIGLTTNGNTRMGLRFGASVIEGVGVDLELIQKAALVIEQSLIRESRSQRPT